MKYLQGGSRHYLTPDQITIITNNENRSTLHDVLLLDHHERDDACLEIDFQNLHPDLIVVKSLGKSPVLFRPESSIHYAPRFMVMPKDQNVLIGRGQTRSFYVPYISTLTGPGLAEISISFYDHRNAKVFLSN